MKSRQRLEWFITFILLTAVPKRRVVAVRDFTHIQPVAGRLPLAQFLKNVLDRVRAHDSLQNREPGQAELVFRIGTPE